MPAPAVPQTYATHHRWYWPYHFVIVPILTANLAFAIAGAARTPSWAAVWNAIVAAALILLGAVARQQSLTVQNRVVRLETQLRLARVLPPALAQRVGELRTRQLIGLRFASDAELPALVQRCLDGELTTSRAIKQQVVQWQGDYLRV